MYDCDYKIASNDQIEYRIASNNGYRLVDIKDMNMINNRSELIATVESDGYIKFPLIGNINISTFAILSLSSGILLFVHYLKKNNYKSNTMYMI